MRWKNVIRVWKDNSLDVLDLWTINIVKWKGGLKKLVYHEIVTADLKAEGQI